MGRWFPGGRNRRNGLSHIVDDDDMPLLSNYNILVHILCYGEKGFWESINIKLGLKMTTFLK